MASYLPPTEELPIFDNQVFDTVNNTALTYAEAKKYFVSYPIAQGTATITDLITGEISYQSPASGSTFEIGTNQVSGGTIKIGPTGSAVGVSVHCANLDFRNNAMNNATSNTGGDISIASLQTTGTLNIGTAIRTVPINIGNNTSASNTGGVNVGSRGLAGTGGGPLNLYGTAIDINCANITTAPMTLSTYVNNPITIASAGNLNLNSTNAGTVYLGTTGSTSVSIGSLSSPTTPTTVNGTLTSTGLITASGGLTMSGTSGITLPATSYVPTSAQLGYFANAALGNVGVTTTTTSVWTIPSNQPIGIYLVSFSVQLTSWSAGATQWVTHSTATTACDVGVQFFNTVGTTLANGNGETFSGILKYTSATNAFALRLATNLGTVTATSPSYTLTRIA